MTLKGTRVPFSEHDRRAVAGVPVLDRRSGAGDHRPRGVWRDHVVPLQRGARWDALALQRDADSGHVARLEGDRDLRAHGGVLHPQLDQLQLGGVPQGRVVLVVGRVPAVLAVGEGVTTGGGKAVEQRLGLRGLAVGPGEHEVLTGVAAVRFQARHDRDAVALLPTEDQVDRLVPAGLGHGPVAVGHLDGAGRRGRGLRRQGGEAGAGQGRERGECADESARVLHVRGSPVVCGVCPAPEAPNHPVRQCAAS